MENNNIHLMPAMNSEDRAALRERQNSLLNDVPFPLNPVDPLTEDDDWNTDDEITGRFSISCYHIFLTYLCLFKKFNMIIKFLSIYSLYIYILLSINDNV